MKNKNLFILQLLVSLLFITSCNFLGVDDNEVILDEFSPVYKITGTVYTAGGEELPGATVAINGESVVSDMNGAYTLSFDEFPASGSVLTAEADGFIASDLTINYDADAPYVYSATFNLTRALPAGFVNLAEGGELVFEDVRIEIPGNNSATYQGETLSEVQLSVTPLSPISTFGSFNGSALKTLVFNPAGIEFAQEITIYIAIPEGINVDNLSLVSYDAASNSWSSVNASISFNSATNEISFKQTITESTIRLNFQSLVIDTDVTGTENVVIRYEPTSCNCETAFTWTGGAYLAKYTLETAPGSPFTADIFELRDLHFFVTNNVTWNEAYIVGQLVDNVVTGVSIGTCESKEVTFSRQYREITGSYEYNDEEKEFIFRYYYGNTTPVISNAIDCAITTPCHQGCVH